MDKTGSILQLGEPSSSMDKVTQAGERSSWRIGCCEEVWDRCWIGGWVAEDVVQVHANKEDGFGKAIGGWVGGWVTWWVGRGKQFVDGWEKEGRGQGMRLVNALGRRREGKCLAFRWMGWPGEYFSRGCGEG